MASSDEEEERVPRCVTDYYFEDKQSEPISFAELPLQWRDGESIGGKIESIFLRGKVDNGIRIIHAPATAWKFDLSDSKLKIFVLSKNSWVKFQSPKKSYAENFIRTILITLHVLHYCRNHSRSSFNKALFDHLSQVYRFLFYIPNTTLIQISRLSYCCISLFSICLITNLIFKW